jgi:hypothetical protein
VEVKGVVRKSGFMLNIAERSLVDGEPSAEITSCLPAIRKLSKGPAESGTVLPGSP